MEMTVLTKKQFRQHFESLKKGLGKLDGPLWEPEKYFKVNTRWFTCVKVIKTVSDDEYFFWLQNNCAGTVLCFSSDTDNNEEWYGFTHHADIMLWLLRWQ